LGHFQDVVGKYPVLGACKSLSSEDTERLKTAVQANGRKWTLVAKQVGSTPMRCQSRYEKLVQKGAVENPPVKRPQRTQEFWTPEEKQAFDKYIDQADKIDYEVLTQCVKTKTKHQCESRLHWLVQKNALPENILLKRPRSCKRKKVQ
jgi:dsDNA-binding SOS-regulon protein